MARSDNTTTWLSLDEWAQIMGYPLSVFNGFAHFPCYVGGCSTVWYQYDHQNDTLSREALAIAIREAEDIISSYVGYNLLPDWDKETVMPPRYRIPELTWNLTSQMLPKSVQVSKKHVIQLGTRAKTLIEAGAAIVRVDKDGDGFAETARVTISSALDHSQIRVFYPDEDGSEYWEIRPIKMSGSPTVVIEFPIWLAGKPSVLYGNCADALDPTDANNFFTTVDVYQVYNDTTDQVTLVYENVNADCSDTDSPCDLVSVSNCGYVRDGELGYVVYNNASATYNILATNRDPNQIELNYFSGHRNRRLSRPLAELDPYWKTAIAYLATAFLDRPIPNSCDGNQPLVASQWQIDLAMSAKGLPSYFVTPFIVENPFGVTTRGAWHAYNKARNKRLRL